MKVSSSAAADSVVVVRPASGWPHLNWALMWRYRELLWTFVGRDIKLRYRQTLLGIVWVVVQPLLAAGVFTFIFSKVAHFSSQGVPYFLFAYGGLLGWNVFSGTLSKAGGSILSNSGLVSKVFFPRLLLPFSAALSTLLDFAVTFTVLLGLMAWNGIWPGPAMMALPLWLALFVLLGLGLGLVCSALMVFYRDVGYVLPVVTNLLMYASPVMFPLDQALDKLPARYHWFFIINPLSGLLGGLRWSLFGTPLPSTSTLAYSVGASLAAFWIGALAFQRMERRFADII